MVDFHVFSDHEELSQVTASLLVAAALEAIAVHGTFTIALSGGSTPERLFEILATEHKDTIPWDKTIIFWGDDRVVPPDHEWSNYRMAYDLLLSKVPIPEENIFRIKGELGPEEAAKDMLANLITIFGDEEIPQFDIVLQGMGDDGHTASLFPGDSALTATDWVVPVFNPPADPAVDRVTLTFPVLNAARLAVFMASGESKQQLLQEIMNDPTAPERYPAACVEAQETVWYIDEAAFGNV